MTHVDINRLKRLASTTLATVSTVAMTHTDASSDSRCPSTVKKMISRVKSRTATSSSAVGTHATGTGLAPDPAIPVIDGRTIDTLACEYEDAGAGESDAHLSLTELVKNSSYTSRGNSLFELQHPMLLRINLKNSTSSRAWIKHGTRVASQGSIKYRAQGVRDQCVSNMLKKALTAEGMKLVKCEGDGVVLCADEQKLLHVLELAENEVLHVNGSNMLAMCDGLKYDIKFMNGMNVASGMYWVKVCGKGVVAFGCQGAIFALQATDKSPVYTDPHTTVAWTHPPSLKVDVNLKSIIGKGSGEEVQFEFKDGFVIVQPFQHIPSREPITPSGII